MDPEIIGNLVIKNIKPEYLIVFIVVAMVGLGVITLIVIDKNDECVADPFTYGAMQLEQEGNPLMCSCSFDNQRYTGFEFDEDGIRVKEDTNKWAYNWTIKDSII